MLAFKNPGIETVGSSVSHHLSTNIEDLVVFPASTSTVQGRFLLARGFKRPGELRNANSLQDHDNKRTKTTRPLPSLCRVSSALPNAVPEFGLQFLGNFGDIHMAIQCYSATQLSVSKAQATQCHVASMSRPCLARMLLLQICKSLLVSEWVATPGTEGERFMALYGEGFSMFVRYHKYIQTHTYFQVFQRVQQPVNTIKKSWTFIGQSWLSYPEILPSGNFAHNVSILPHCSTVCCSECRDAVLSHAMSHNCLTLKTPRCANWAAFSCPTTQFFIFPK